MNKFSKLQESEENRKLTNEKRREKWWRSAISISNIIINHGKEWSDIDKEERIETEIIRKKRKRFFERLNQRKWRKHLRIFDMKVK
jgi:hypothetical protein